MEAIRALLRERQNRIEPGTPSAMPSIIPLNVHGEPFKGDAHAKVAIVEYSDFDCSFCATYAHDIFPLIDDDYIKPGKVKYFFRDLPAREHTNALFKAQAA